MSPLPPLVAVAAATSPLSYGGKGDGVFGETVEGQRKAPLSIATSPCPPVGGGVHIAALARPCVSGSTRWAWAASRAALAVVFPRRGAGRGEYLVRRSKDNRLRRPSLPLSPSLSFSYSPAYPLQPSQASPSPPASFLHRSFFVVVLEQRWPTELM